MRYDTGTLDRTLAAAAGNDPALIAELREAFHQSLAYQVDLLSRARCDGNWRISSLRLKDLAAGFHATPLIALAEEALHAAPGEPAIVRALQDYLKAIAEHGARSAQGAESLIHK